MPIRRIEGATQAPEIYVNGKKVTLWTRGTIADGEYLTENTLRPICSAINDGYGDLSAAIIDEAEERTIKDEELQGQIDTLKAATDVIMVYGDYQSFTTNSGDLALTDADIIKVLVDEDKNNQQVYYQWYDPESGHEWSNWSAIGSLNPYYSKTELNGAAGTNINITTANGIKINTNDYVTFSAVSSNGFSGTNLSGVNNNDSIDKLFGSAYSGAKASAYITANSGDFLNSAHNAYGKLTFGTKEYPATNSNYNFTFIAGQGIGFTTANNQVTISAEGTTYQASSYISTANKAISVTGTLITSASAGSAAYNLLTGQSASLYPGAGIQFYSADENKLGIKVSAEGINGTITSIAGSALAGGASYTDGRYIYIDNNSINLSSNIIIDYMSATSALLSADYTGGIYFNYLTPSSTRFTYGFGAATISLTGVEISDRQTTKSIPWNKLVDGYVLTTGNASGSKLSANTAITLVVTSQLPTVLENNTYYIV